MSTNLNLIYANTYRLNVMRDLVVIYMHNAWLGFVFRGIYRWFNDCHQPSHSVDRGGLHQQPRKREPLWCWCGFVWNWKKDSVCLCVCWVYAKNAERLAGQSIVIAITRRAIKMVSKWWCFGLDIWKESDIRLIKQDILFEMKALRFSETFVFLIRGMHINI